MSFDVSHMEMAGVGDYAGRAAHCLLLAKQTPSRETKLVLLDMARAWLLLAEQNRKNGQNALVGETPKQQ
jgi:hypothetical protein